MARPSARQRAAEIARLRLPCGVSGCGHPRAKLSRYCDAHDQRDQRTGHPEGRTIRASELRPYVKLTARYIAENREHPEIARALRWLYGLINSTRRPVTYLRQKAHPSERLTRWLIRMRDAGVHENKVLAIIAALYLMRDREPRAFRSDRHFRHMLAIRFLRVAPPPRVAVWRNGAGGVKYDRIGVTLRDHLADTLTNNIGLLSLRIARTLGEAVHKQPQAGAAGA